MKRTFVLSLGLCLVFIFCSVDRAEARLGDSLETLDKKHGEGKVLAPQKSLQLKLYENDGLSILVYFKNGRSAKEVYSKLGAGFVSPEIFQALLKANSAQKLWLPLDDKGEVSAAEEPARLKSEQGEYSVLVREDRQAFAQLFFSGDKIVTIVISAQALVQEK